MKIVFVCHPFAGDPKGNVRKVRGICALLASEGTFPLAPQIYLPQFLDEATERALALRISGELVALSDEVRVYGKPTEGMRFEIAEANRLGIPVVEEKIE